MTPARILPALYLALLALALCWAEVARGHSWYPPSCCSGFDCRPISQDAVQATSTGFFIRESGETIPYSDTRIRITPPEGGGLVHRCSVGGNSAAPTICIYIPSWGN